MKPALTILLTVVPGLALAHPGHIADAMGHDHWVAGAAIGAAVVVGLWGALKGRREKAKTKAQAEDHAAEPQES